MASAVFSPISPPPLHNGPQHQEHPSPRISHSVNRSTEFLSAARTAFKILQQQHRQQRTGEGNHHHYDNHNQPIILPEWMADLNPIELNLYQLSESYHGEAHDDTDNALSLIRDSQTLLNLLDGHLAELHTLVRRRGHTNDPTLEIQSLMEKFQESAREIKDVCESLRLAGTRPYFDYSGNGGGTLRTSSQRRKHYEMLSQQLESQAKERTDQLKKELETRSQVLRDQSHRRKLLASGGGPAGPAVAPSGNGSRAITSVTRLTAQNTSALNLSSQLQSPLFTTTSGGTAANKKNTIVFSTTNNAHSSFAGYAGSSTTAIPSTSTISATNRGGGGAGGYAGYGGTLSAPPSFATGMRQRKQQNSQPSQMQQYSQPKSHIQVDSGNEDNYYDEKYSKSSSMTEQISMRREQRATHIRAQQARLAEKSIAELGVMFHKMSSLIVAQGETLERIEDDVESAGLDIDAGHDELVKVYGMTKGNRGLILKVFGVLIFLIIFMKLY